MGKHVVTITPCSRPQNIAKLLKSVEEAQKNNDCIVTSIVVYDGEDLTDVFNVENDAVNVVFIAHKDQDSRYGNAQRNEGIRFITEELSLPSDTVVYFLDDDNIMHKDLILELTHDKYSVYNAFSFPQHLRKTNFKTGVRLKPTTEPKVGTVDSANFAVRLSLIGDTRWVLDRYEADGLFFEELSKKTEYNPVVIEKELAYYNDAVRKEKGLIVFLIEAEHGTAFHRLMIPALGLHKAGYSVAIAKSIVELVSMNAMDIHAVVTSRMFAVPSHTALRKWANKNGITIVVDVDDRWYLDFKGDKNHFDFYNKYAQEYIKATIKMADVVWVASKYLGDRVRKEFKKPHVFYVPNAIDAEVNDWSEAGWPSGDDVIFGYVAALGHNNDIQPLKGLFEGKKLLTVKFKDSPALPFQYGEFLGSTTHLEEPMGWGTYNSMYDKIHVAIAPLAKNDFNYCKSNLKAIEAGFKKRAFIASDIPLYREIIKHGENGLLCANRHEWQREINAMTVEKAKDFGEALYESIKDEFSIRNVNEIRMNSLFG